MQYIEKGDVVRIKNMPLSIHNDRVKGKVGVVLGQNLDSSLNGGFEGEISMDAFTLPDFSSLLTVEYNHNETILIVDSLQLSTDFVSETGSSTQLSVSSYEEESNDSSLWCLSDSSFGDGDLGTPGSDNSTCQ